MIGDLRTDALHQALRDATIDDGTLLALLVLALGGRNVSIHSGADTDAFERDEVCKTITEGGVLTTDQDLLRRAARSMLVGVLSCRENMSNSGITARIAGDAIGASLYLPNMATEEFLSCLSKAGVEKAAATEGVRIENRAKDTRARLIERFKDGVYVHPAALFKLTAEDLAKAKAAEPRRFIAGGWNDPNGEDEETRKEPGRKARRPRDDEAGAFDAGPWADSGNSEGAVAAE